MKAKQFFWTVVACMVFGYLGYRLGYQVRYIEELPRGLWVRIIEKDGKAVVAEVRNTRSGMTNLDLKVVTERAPAVH